MLVRPKTSLLLIFAIVAIAFFAIQWRYFPPGVDYYFFFQPALRDWVAGNSIFNERYEFYNAPWVLIFLRALMPLGDLGSEAALELLTFAVILQGWRLFGKSYSGYVQAWSLAIILFNLYYVDLLLRGQLDGFVLAGLLLMYLGLRDERPYLLGLGWALAVVRPSSIILVGLYSIWLAYQRGYLAKALLIPSATFALSLPLFGWTWYADWLHFLLRKNERQPVDWLVTWWRIAQYYDWPARIPTCISLLLLAVTGWALWRYRPDLKTAFGFLSAASLVVTPYALSYHFSILLVLFIPLLLQWRLWLALPLYLGTLLPLLRVPWGADTAWIDILFPLGVWALFLVYFWQNNAPKMRTRFV
jgi:hypothetical protein